MAAAPLFAPATICSLCPRRRKCRGIRPVQFRVVFALLASVVYLGLSSPALAQRSDRAIISGVVSDPQGAAVPGATVTIHNVATGVDTVLVTNDAGAYTSPPLVLGTYKVKVELQGFSVVESGEIAPQGGEQVRNDVTMAVGNVSETVQVQGRDRDRRDDARGGAQRRSEVLRGPPIRHRRRRAPRRVGAAHAARLPAHAAQRRPDVPRQPVQLPHQRRAGDGDRRTSSTAPPSGTRAATSRVTRARRRSSRSRRRRSSRRPTRPSTGHTSGGFIEYTSKSGTNDYHGSGYYYTANDRFNANTVFAEKSNIGKTPISNNNPGFTFGGPLVLPPATTAGTRRSSSRTSTTRGSARARGRLRQHHADRRVQERRLQLAAHGAADRHRRAWPADHGRPDLRPVHDAPRQRHTGPRSVREQPDSRGPPAAEHRGVPHRAVDGGARSRRARQQRRGDRHRRPDVGAQCPEHHGTDRSQLLAELPVQSELLLEPAAIDPELRRRGRLQRRVRSRA